MSKERPIIMHARSINGILEGRKTQTRRIAKIPDYVRVTEAPQKRRGEPPKHPAPYFDAYDGGPFWCWWDEYDRCGDGVKCPYGVVGDRLWVRETFGVFSMEGSTVSVFYKANLPEGKTLGDTDGGTNPKTLDSLDDVRVAERLLDICAERWHSPIFMPRWASRLTLEITNIRFAHVQDIGEEDAKAEGVQVPCTRIPGTDNGKPLLNISTRIDSHKLWRDNKNATLADYFTGYFALLWDDTNGKGAWDRNDWVWVVEFKRLGRNE